MIARVKSAGNPMLFSVATSEAKCMKLPFFEKFMLYRLTNFSSLPTFSMDFLSDGESYFYMDGTDTPIKHVQDSEKLVITEDTVIPYLNFYFCFVRLPEGEIILLKSPEEAAIIDLYDDERREEFDARPTPLKIDAPRENGPINVTAPALYDSSPIEAIISVEQDGTVITRPTRMLTMGKA